MTEMTPHQQVVELVERYRSGQVPAEQVIYILGLLDGDLDTWIERIASLEPPQDTEAESRALLEESLAGLEMVRQAVELVRQYVQTGDEELAQQAIQAAEEGVALIVQVRNVTEENIERILDEADSAE